MTIICPNCDATYRIGAEALGDGRTVRCARCRSEWFAAGPDRAPSVDQLASLEPPSLELIDGLDDAVAIDAIESSDPRALADPFEPQPSHARRDAGSRSWFRRPSRPRRGAAGAVRKPSRFRTRPAAIFAGLGAIAIGGLLGERVEVVRAAPSLASLYATIGLPVNVRGLAIADVRSIERIEEGVPLLLVSGVVRNVSGDAIDIPRLRLTITGERGRELYVWTTVAARARLAAGESASFRARLASPPAEGRGLSVRFVAQADLERPAH